MESFPLRSGDDFRGPDTLVLDSRQASGKDSLANEGDGHAVVQSVDGSPFTGTFLACCIQDLLDDRHTVFVVEPKNVASDLNQERIENALLPLE